MGGIKLKGFVDAVFKQAKSYLDSIQVEIEGILKERQKEMEGITLDDFYGITNLAEGIQRHLKEQISKLETSQNLDESTIPVNIEHIDKSPLDTQEELLKQEREIKSKITGLEYKQTNDENYEEVEDWDAEDWNVEESKSVISPEIEAARKDLEAVQAKLREIDQNQLALAEIGFYLDKMKDLAAKASSQVTKLINAVVREAKELQKTSEAEFEKGLKFFTEELNILKFKEPIEFDFEEGLKFSTEKLNILTFKDKLPSNSTEEKRQSNKGKPKA